MISYHRESSAEPAPNEGVQPRVLAPSESLELLGSSRQSIAEAPESLEKEKEERKVPFFCLGFNEVANYGPLIVSPIVK